MLETISLFAHFRKTVRSKAFPKVTPQMVTGRTRQLNNEVAEIDLNSVSLCVAFFCFRLCASIFTMRHQKIKPQKCSMVLETIFTSVLTRGNFSRKIVIGWTPSISLINLNLFYPFTTSVLWSLKIEYYPHLEVIFCTQEDHIKQWADPSLDTLSGVE